MRHMLERLRLSICIGLIERPRVQTSHFFGSFWPHSAGFNRLGVAATVSESVYEELRARGRTFASFRHVWLRNGRAHRPGDG